MSLTFVPTPLGNLRDITLRALDVLRDCDLLVAEDTRVAKRLLSALDLPGKEIWSYREQNAAGATAAIVARARVHSVAVVTDAGTPAISDPGRGLVAAARDAGVAIDVLPGPSAFVCALVLSGFALDRFAFDGFVPRTSGARERSFRDAFASGRTTAYYEAPNRIERRSQRSKPSTRARVSFSHANSRNVSSSRSSAPQRRSQPRSSGPSAVRSSSFSAHRYRNASR